MQGRPGITHGLPARGVGAYLSRSITRRTSLGSHIPLPVAGTPRAFRAFATPSHDVMPPAQSAATMGASSAALASAFFLRASTAAAQDLAPRSLSSFWFGVRGTSV
jgi:hypothetical protein